MAPIILTLFTFAAATALLAQTMWLGFRGTDGPRLPDEQIRRHLMWRAFYVNPADPRGWVPKVWGIGWTVNFRSPAQVYVFVALVIASLGTAIALTVSVL